MADRLNKVMMACGCVITADLVVVDAVRYVLSQGVMKILFLPSCLPACFIIIMLCSAPQAGVEERELRWGVYLLGIPLLLLSLYFEILSFR